MPATLKSKVIFAPSLLSSYDVKSFRFSNTGGTAIRSVLFLMFILTLKSQRLFSSGAVHIEDCVKDGDTLCLCFRFIGFVLFESKNEITRIDDFELYSPSIERTIY